MRTVFAEFKRKEPALKLSPCVIETVVELPTKEFKHFEDNLLDEYDFIRDCEEPLHTDTNGVNHCMLVLGKGLEDGILVCSEGYSYARYSAHFPNARLHLRQEMHPSLDLYADVMQKLAEQFTQAAITCQDDGCYSLSFESVRRRAGDTKIDVDLFATTLSERPEFQLVELEENRIHAFLSSEYIVRQRNTGTQHLSKREVTSVIERHQLWVNGDGGGCADFSNCYLDNFKFPCADLRGANFDGAVLVNVSMPDSDLSEASFRRAKLHGCDMRNIKANDACFVGASFRDNDMSWVNFNNCNLKDALFSGCELDFTSLQGCCIEGTSFDEFARLPSDMTGCVDDEETWSAPKVEMKL